MSDKAELQEQPKNTAIVPIGKVSGCLIPTDLDSMWRIAGVIMRSGLAPKGMDSQDKVCGAIAFGLELGLSPFQAVQNIASINGRPTVWGDAMPGLVQASGLLEDFTEEQIAEGGGGWRVTAKRKGVTTPTVRKFTMDDAKRAGLFGKQGPWSQYPDRMCLMRARSWALRDGFSDVLRGLVAREEAADMPPIEAEYEEVRPPAPNSTPLKINTGPAEEDHAAEPESKPESKPADDDSGDEF